MKSLLPAFVISFAAEIATLYWTWVSAPTDGLRVRYQMNFVRYASERMLPWLIVFAFLWVVFLLFRRFAARRTGQQRAT